MLQGEGSTPCHIECVGIVFFNVTRRGLPLLDINTWPVGSKDQLVHVIEVSNEIRALLGGLVGAPTNSSSPCLSPLLFLDVVVVVVVGRKGAKCLSSFSSDVKESVGIN